jgi:signal transduction histidine kinase
VDLDKIPGNVQTLSAGDLSRGFAESHHGSEYHAQQRQRPVEHCVDEWRRRLDEMRHLAIYRLVQEALTNRGPSEPARWAM